MVGARRTFSMVHPIIVTFLILAIIAAMSLASQVMKPLALAILLSFALVPIARFLERIGLPRRLSVALTVVTALGALGGVAYVVGQQLTTLVVRLPDYEENIKSKVRLLKPAHESALDKAGQVASDVAAVLEGPKQPGVVDVRVVSQRPFLEKLASALGPSLEGLMMGILVLILVLFLLLNREDLRDRMIRLFGRGRVTVTTRTMDEIGQRISRYLAAFSLVNSSYGLIVGLGLWAVGLPYATLWGFLAAGLRFIPYVGPATAFLLPFLFAIAQFPTWAGPLLVAGLFGMLEVLANSVLEPVIYGKTTGVTAIGLLVSAMFWTWLWGALGLLLSTPLTVCLAVLGKYVPSLAFFSTLLGEDSELESDLRYYHRLLAFDHDGAEELVEQASKQQSRIELFERILIPALIRSERDSLHGEIDDRERTFVWRVTGDILDELNGTEAASYLGQENGQAKTSPPLEHTPAVKIVGVAVNDAGDTLVLRMLEHLLRPSRISLEIIADGLTPMQVADRLADESPSMVLLSHLPPSGLTPTRYLVRRLRARFAQLPIVVGCWGNNGCRGGVVEQLEKAGATRVVLRLSDACDGILASLVPKTPTPPPLSPAPAVSSH